MSPLARLAHASYRPVQHNADRFGTIAYDAFLPEYGRNTCEEVNTADFTTIGSWPGLGASLV